MGLSHIVLPISHIHPTKGCSVDYYKHDHNYFHDNRDDDYSHEHHNYRVNSDDDCNNDDLNYHDNDDKFTFR